MTMICRRVMGMPVFLAFTLPFLSNLLVIVDSFSTTSFVWLPSSSSYYDTWDKRYHQQQHNIHGHNTAAFRTLSASFWIPLHCSSKNNNNNDDDEGFEAKSSSSSSSSSSIEKNEDNNTNDDDNDIMETPKAKAAKDNNNNNNTTNIPLPQAPKYMTAMEQSYREAELELLADLRYGDDTIHKFRELWYSERGEQVEEIMYRAWEGLGHPDYWPTAERTLMNLIEDDATYLHPFVLLSKLYCLQGKFEESKRICEQILHYKPYHFVVLETMVANCVALQQLTSMQQWEAKRLPKPSNPEARLEWVKRAIDDATRLLEEAKELNMPLVMEGGSSDDGIIKDDDALGGGGGGERGDGATESWQ